MHVQVPANEKLVTAIQASVEDSLPDRDRQWLQLLRETGSTTVTAATTSVVSSSSKQFSGTPSSTAPLPSDSRGVEPGLDSASSSSGASSSSSSRLIRARALLGQLRWGAPQDGMLDALLTQSPPVKPAPPGAISKEESTHQQQEMRQQRVFSEDQHLLQGGQQGGQQQEQQEGQQQGLQEGPDQRGIEPAGVSIIRELIDPLMAAEAVSCNCYGEACEDIAVSEVRVSQRRSMNSEQG